MIQVYKELKNLFSSKTKLHNFLYCLSAVMIALYCFSMWSFGSRPFWNYVNIAICSVMLIVILIYQFLYSDIKFDTFALLLLTFCFSIILSSLINFRIGSMSKSVFLMAVFAFAFYQFSRSKLNLKISLVALAIGGSAFVFFYIIVYWKPIFTFDFSTRLGDFFDNQNEVAKNFVFLGLILLYLILLKKKFYMIPFYFLMFYLLATTGSMSNILCFILSTLFLMFFSAKRGKRIWVLIFILSVVIALVLLIQLPVFIYFKTRVSGILSTLMNGDGDSDPSSSGRIEFAMDAVRLFLNRPLFGYGYDAVRLFTFGIGSPAHNNIAELLGDFGIFGFVSFEMIIIYPFVRIMSCTGKNKYLFLGLLFYVFIFQFFLVTYYTKIEYMIFACCFGYISSLSTHWIGLKIDNGKLHFEKGSLKKKVPGPCDHNFGRTIDPYTKISI